MELQIQSLLQGYFDLQTSDADKLAGYFQHKTIKHGEFFFQKNKLKTPFAFIESGFIRIFDYSDGKEITQWVSSPGDLITDILGLFFDQPNRWNAIAITDVKLKFISHTDYKQLGSEIPNWNSLEKGFIAKCFRVLEERVFGFLSMTAKERYDHFMDKNGDLANQIPLIYQASLLGMSPETLSRVRAMK